MRPGRQRRVHQAAVRVQHREVDRGTGAVQVGDEAAQPVRQFLLAAHAGQRGHRHVEAAGGLFERAGQQRVRCQLGEDPVAVLQGGLHRRGEPHHASQVVRPIPASKRRCLARVEQAWRSRTGTSGVIGSRSASASVELTKDRIDLRRVEGDVGGHLAGHHVALLPRRDQIADGLRGTGDHGGLRRSHHGQHDVVDAARRQLGKHLLGRQFHRRGGAGAGDACHQSRAAADRPDAPSSSDSAPADDSRGGLTQRVADDRAGRTPYAFRVAASATCMVNKVGWTRS